MLERINDARMLAPEPIHAQGDHPATPLKATPRGIDLLERVAVFSEQTHPCSAKAAGIAILSIFLAAAMRFACGRALVDPGFSVFIAAILATGLLAGMPAAIGAAASSVFIVTLAFLPPYFVFKWLNVSDQIVIAFNVIASVVTICLSQCCRMILRRMIAREMTNKMLLRELNHRGRNLFSITQLIVRRSLPDQPHYANEIIGRLGAAYQANELLMSLSGSSCTIRTLLAHEFAAYGLDRIVTRGPEIAIEPDAGRHLLLLFHEWATNAAKYGALSSAGGRVFVKWRWNGGRQVALTWKESGGPTVVPPGREGFGSKLIAMCLTALGGTIEPLFLAEGYSYRINFSTE
jgi:two-component sensor histidine kinase